MERIRLSLLICHLVDRRKQLLRLLSILSDNGRHVIDLREDGTGQLVSSLGALPVEIRVNGDEGGKSVGQKRNELLFAARGDYVAYIDDDDKVSEDYIDAILKATESDPDCVGIEGMIECNIGRMLFRHSIQFQGWYTAEDAFYRIPNHLNPVKRKIAQRFGFPNENIGEDHRYSEALRRSIKTEEYIDHPIYFYLDRKEYPVK